MAKNLGSYLTINSSAVQDVNHRYSQAGRCLKSLDAFYRHSQISYNANSLSTRKSPWRFFFSGQNPKHIRSLRCRDSTAYTTRHSVRYSLCRVYLLKLACEHMPQLQPPSQSIQSSRLAYLGHLLRHESQLEVHTPRYNTRQGDVTLFYLLEKFFLCGKISLHLNMW